MKTILLLALAFLLAGCDDNFKASMQAHNRQHRITLYSNDGKPIKEWISEGAPTEIDSSFHFRDADTGLSRIIRGTISVETL